MDDQSLKSLREGLLAWKKQLAEEVGTEPPCPFCKKPRVKRSDYIRCNSCAVNWLDEERHLPDYLSRNPAAARHEDADVKGASTAENSSTKAWRDRQAEKIRSKLGLSPLGGTLPAPAAVEEQDENPFAEGK